MSRELKRIFVHGFPSLYGGAGTELHHQIIVWCEMGMEVHLIPTGDGFYQNEEVRQKDMPVLKALHDDPAIRFMTFKPYFHNEAFPFIG